MGRSSQTTSQTASVPQYYQDFLTRDLFPAARNFANQDFQAYQGEMTAGVSPLSMGTQTQFGQIADIANMTPQDYAAMTQANMSPYQEQVIDAALARSNRDRQIAQTGEMAQITNANAFGNERRGVFEAERAAAYDVGRDQLVADLMQQGYNQAQASTMAQLGARQGAAGQAAAGMMQLGGLDQMTRQAELDAQYQEFMREQNLPLQQLGALVSASSGAQIPMSSTQTTSGRSGLSGILGAAGSIGQGIAAIAPKGIPFFSDRRLKTNIRRIGKRDGVAFYSWDWNEVARELGVTDHPTSGVIAQELEELHPDLVATGPDGFKRVDYAGLEARFS